MGYETSPPIRPQRLSDALTASLRGISTLVCDCVLQLSKFAAVLRLYLPMSEVSGSVALQELDEGETMNGMAEDVKSYSLQSAAEVTGSSLGRFRYNREALITLGTQIDGSGWHIPEAALLELGWLNPSKPAAPKKTKLELLQEELKTVRAENAELRKQLTEATTRRGIFGKRKAK